MLGERRQRHRPVDEAELGGDAAVELLAGHNIIERLAVVDQGRQRLRHDAAGNDAPVDLGQAEHRLFRGHRKVAANHRRKGAAEAPAVDHGDRRLAVEHQLAPLPIARLAVGPMALEIALLVGGAEEIAQIHAGGKRLTFAGQDQDAAAIVKLERVQHLVHLGRKRHAHRVALLRAVQLHPGDAVLEFDLDVVAPRDRSLRRICLIRHRPCLQRPARASHRRLPYIRYPFIMAAVGQSTDAVRVSAAMETTGAGTLHLVHLLTHASRSRLDAALAHLELSSFQYTALSALACNENLSSSRLSRRFQVTPQAMGELILLLERRGLIERRADLANKKALLLSLTKSGRALWAKADAIAREFEQALFGELSRGEISSLRSIMINALATLRGGDEPPKPRLAPADERRRLVKA